MPPTHCAHCGYRIDKTDSPTCPECGTPFSKSGEILSVVHLATAACRLLAVYLFIQSLDRFGRWIFEQSASMLMTNNGLPLWLASWPLAPAAGAVVLWFAAPWVARRIVGVDPRCTVVAASPFDWVLHTGIVLIGLYFAAAAIADLPVQIGSLVYTLAQRSQSGDPDIRVAPLVDGIAFSIIRLLVGILLVISHRPLVRLIHSLREWGAAKSD